MPEPQISSLDLSNIGSGSNVLSSFGDFFSGLLKTDNKYDLNKIAGIAGLAGSGMGLFDRRQQPTGYQGGIPDYTVVRKPVRNMYDAEQRRPGSRGRRYFTKTRFVPTEDSDLLSQERLFAAEEAEGIRRAQNTIESPTGGVASVAPTVMTPGPTSLPASGVVTSVPSSL